MRVTVLKSLVGIAIVASFFAVPAFSAPKSVAADGGAVAAPVQQVDLSESSRASSDVANFLSQPALSEALTKAKSDKKTAAEAAQNPNAFLSRNGVQVPANMKLQIKPPAGGGAEARTGIEIRIKCCPLVITIIIYL